MTVRMLLTTACVMLAGSPAAAQRADASDELASLRRENAALIGKLLGDPRAASGVQISLMGKGRTGPADFSEPADDPATGPGASVKGFVAFNSESGNEYLISIPPALLKRIGDAGARAGLGKPGISTPASPETRPSDPTRGANAANPLLHRASWSGDVDNRTRLSSLTSGTDRWVWRAIADLGGCTATLVGPRHAITAGHCIYNRTKKTWSAGFKVTPGRAGPNWNYGKATVPSAPFTWYFTPVGWRTAGDGSSQFDIGILVLSERLGDKTSWMGWWHGSDTYLKSTPIWNRGYPLCSATEADGTTPRTDDPGDPGSSVVCVGGHLYGDVSTCPIGSFSASDGMGWTRRMTHGCDASAGQSGSPLYLFRSDTPYVTAVHTTSSCGKNANAANCTASDKTPLTATRVTEEYSNWLYYFRAWKP